MTSPDRVAFLAERSTGIGGSDIASVFSVGYGCSLRLYRQKRQEVPDFPLNETGPMELGRLLEPYFADHYERITGRPVTIVGVQRHSEHDELLVHVDRIVEAEERKEPGVLEIKAVGREMFYRIRREGMPIDYVLQLQHGMLCTGLTWGAFCVGCRDFGVSRPEDLLRWDVERDEESCQQIEFGGIEFWQDVQAGIPPPMLDAWDKRCGGCEYRVSCQGAALVQIENASEYEADESLRPLAAEYLERQKLRKEAEEMCDETSEEIKYRMGERTRVSAGGPRINYTKVEVPAYTVKARTDRRLTVYGEKKKQSKKGK